MARKSPLSGVSWLQLVAGALAAMTSAWVASYLGVAGTIIGAAVGSLVASIASAIYVNGLDRGTTYVTQSGSVVTRAQAKDDPAEGEGDDDTEVLVTEEESVVSVEESDRRFSWRRVLTWTGLLLATSLLVIGGYELVTGSSFGNPDNPSIGSSLDDSGSDPTDDPTSTATTAPTTGPTDAATTPTTAPTTAPAPAPSPEPEPTTEPTQTPDTQATEDAG